MGLLDGVAHDQLGHTRTANARYAIVLADYQNSYYGREATRQLDDRRADAEAGDDTETDDDDE